LKSELSKRALDWSSDGKFLLYSVLDPKANSDLWVLPMEGDRTPKPFRQTPFSEIQAQFSPVMPGSPRWVAYASDESGRYQVYVQSFEEGSGSGRQFQVSSGAGGTQPRWRADGKELFYIALDTLDLMAVDVKTSPAFEVGIPRRLFTTRTNLGAAVPFRYAVTADGKRFLVESEAQGETLSTPITVVLNWNAGRNR